MVYRAILLIMVQMRYEIIVNGVWGLWYVVWGMWYEVWGLGFGVWGVKSPALPDKRINALKEQANSAQRERLGLE